MLESPTGRISTSKFLFMPHGKRLSKNITNSIIEESNPDFKPIYNELQNRFGNCPLSLKRQDYHLISI
jgi:hypothetical protein